MTKLVSIALLLFIGLTTQAQDKKAKDLLEEVTTKIKSHQNITIDFKYTLSNSKENINKESKGNVIIQDNKYVLNFMGVTKIYDGKKTYTIVPEDEEVSVSKLADKEDNAITPSKMLSFLGLSGSY